LLTLYQTQMEAVGSEFSLFDASQAFEAGLNKKVLKPVLNIFN